MQGTAVDLRTENLLARWWYAVKPQSWPKVLVSAVLGQALGIAAAGVISWRGALVGSLFTFCHLFYLVLLNDWGDREVDAIKRRMFPDGCSPKTIPDGILPSYHLLIAGTAAGTLGLVVAVLGGWWMGRPWLGLMGAASLMIFQAYTFPPLRLNYRGGGELLEMLGVGVLLPWFNAYAQSGMMVHEVFLVLPGFTLLSLASALASGLSDEESDVAGGKRTFTTMFGNPAVRLGAEVLLVLGVLAWSMVSVRHSQVIPRWTVVPPAGIILWYGWKARAISAQAVTNAFEAQGLYKHYLHCAIWYGTVVLMCLLMMASWAAEIEDKAEGMTSSRQIAFDRLSEVDQQLQSVIPVPLSLCPSRQRATPLYEIGVTLLADDHDDAVVKAFADGLCLMVTTKFDQFPDNIFWDVDYLAGCLLALGNANAMRDLTAHVVTLHEGFGRSSPISFRYVHDFMYGYDWARWVAHDPETRQWIGPFDKTFLYHLEERRGELVEVIAEHDEQYSWMPDGVHRNPFRFSREPADERRLHEALARDNLIPVQAWRFDGARDWTQPYTQIREQYAAKLDIPQRPRGQSQRETGLVAKLM